MLRNLKYLKLIKEIGLGKCLLIDGATGTELENRGVPQIANAWNGGGALTHPEILKNIHKQYIETGARVVISNTFANCKHTLRDAGQVNNFEKLNTAGIKVAQEACLELEAYNVLVAGGVSYWSFTENRPDLKELKSNICEQVLIQKNAGADLIILEMMGEIDRMLVTIEAATEVGLPVWVGLSCQPNALGEMCMLNGDTLSQAIKEINSFDIDLLNIMHTDISFVDSCLDIVEQEWTRFIGLYPHSGSMKKSDWMFGQVIKPQLFEQHVSRWLKRRISLLGGCCGIGVKHMQLISERFFSKTMG